MTMITHFPTKLHQFLIFHYFFCADTNTRTLKLNHIVASTFFASSMAGAQLILAIVTS